MSIAQDLGIEAVGFCSIAQALGAQEQAKPFLESWQNSDYAGDMAYMKRSSDLLCDPTKLLSKVKSIISFIVPYFSINSVKPVSVAGFGRVARYAWGQDYHEVLRAKLEEFILICRKQGVYKGREARVFSDSVPMLERSLASHAGLGFFGKSSMLIRPGLGTYFFLCEILWDADVIGDLVEPNLKSSCGSCARCKNDCPTAAIVGNGVIDARRCISYLTIEKRTLFDKNEISQIGDWIFGCDICQEVCPFNHKAVNSVPLIEFGADYGVGPSLDLAKVLELKTVTDFKKMFNGTPILRTKREGILRNAMAVIANQKYFPYLNLIIDLYKFDSSLFLKEQAGIILRLLNEDSSGIDKLRIERCLEK